MQYGLVDIMLMDYLTNGLVNITLIFLIPISFLTLLIFNIFWKLFSKGNYFTICLGFQIAIPVNITV